MRPRRAEIEQRLINQRARGALDIGEVDNASGARSVNRDQSHGGWLFPHVCASESKMRFNKGEITRSVNFIDRKRESSQFVKAAQELELISVK